MRHNALSNRELIARCIEGGEAEAWEEFIHRTRRLVTGVVYRVATRWNESRAEVLEELVQETYLRLFTSNCKALRDFKPANDDAIYAFVKVLAANIVHDHLRAQNATKRGAHQTESVEAEGPEGAPRLELGVPPKIENHVLLNEMEGWLNRLVSGRDAESQKAIFWLYYRQGLSAASIAEVSAFGLTTKGVESVIYRLTKLLREKLRPEE